MMDGVYIFRERGGERLERGEREDLHHDCNADMHLWCCDNAAGLQPSVFDSTKVLPVCQWLSCYWRGCDPASLVYDFAHIKRWYLNKGCHDSPLFVEYHIFRVEMIG